MKRTLTAALVGLALAISMVGTASAKITSVTTNTCVNNGGQLPAGQQPTCKGGGLNQETTTLNVNPQGKAPPGQN
jgi:hypothetical protein